MQKQPILNLNVHAYWTTYLQAIQKSLSNEYYFYKTGKIPTDKIVSVLSKLTDYYRLCDTNTERFKRYAAGFSTVTIHLLRIDEGLQFILMCRANETQTGLFFEREKYTDARIKRNRINLNECYELIRVNKEAYTYDNQEVATKNGVWTVQLTDKEQHRIYTEFCIALLKRNYNTIKQICYGLHHLIGFAEVRKTYPVLKLKLEKKFAKFMQSQRLAPYKVLADVYKLPQKIGYVHKMKADEITVKDILKC